MSPAVDSSTNFNGAFSIKFPYGNAIQDEVVKFYNLFDSADATLTGSTNS